MFSFISLNVRNPFQSALAAVSYLTLIITLLLPLTVALHAEEKKEDEHTPPRNGSYSYDAGSDRYYRHNTIGDLPTKQPPISDKYSTATGFVYPLMDISQEDLKANSFGVKVPPSAAAFIGKVHVGSDCGWQRPGAQVLSVAEGIVRMSACLPTFNDETVEKRRGWSWGNIIVIEHRLPNGEYISSLYGHLGANRLVKVGDMVKKGQVIGYIGKSNSEENGRYPAHLHFGIHQGRYIAQMKKGERIYLGTAAVKLGDKTVYGYFAEVLEKDGERLNLRSRCGPAGKDETKTVDCTTYERSLYRNGNYGAHAIWITGYQMDEVGTMGWQHPWQFIAANCRLKTAP